MTALPLFAQQALASTLDTLPWFAWIALAAIGFGAVSKIIAMLIEHRERMAMIQMGMHPDRPAAAGRACETKPWVPETSEL